MRYSIRVAFRRRRNNVNMNSGSAIPGANAPPPESPLREPAPVELPPEEPPLDELLPEEEPPLDDELDNGLTAAPTA